MGPITIFDKSALQALSMDEAVWFDAFLLANLVPVFYAETLADLEKEMAAGKDAEDLVGMLATKTPDNAGANVPHREILLSELAGDTVPMTGQGVVRGATKVAADGTVGFHVDEAPEQVAFLRWQEHDFEAVERAAAKAWRHELAEQDLTTTTDLVKGILPTDRTISDLEQLKHFIDEFCSSYEPRVLELALHVLDVPGDYKSWTRKRWRAAKRPPLDEFAPFTTHVLKVDLLFYLGVAQGFISGKRPSNKVDVAYLYYLPFCHVFTSRDRLHHRTAPLFMRDDQTYVEADELKAALRELDAHYEALPNEIKALGVMAFASYPPSDGDNLVTRLWDNHMHPEWREQAKRHEVQLQEPRDAEAGRRTVAELNEKLEGAQLVEDKAGGFAEPDADYLVITRRINATKGKWRIVPRDAEEE